MLASVWSCEKLLLVDYNTLLSNLPVVLHLGALVAVDNLLAGHKVIRVCVEASGSLEIY